MDPSTICENKNIEKTKEDARFERANPILHRIKSHEEHNPRLYKHLIHKSHRRLLDKWMNEKLRHASSLDDVSELEDPFDDVDVKGKTAIVVEKCYYCWYGVEE
jgi:hypothetical protein